MCSEETREQSASLFHTLFNPGSLGCSSGYRERVIGSDASFSFLEFVTTTKRRVPDLTLADFLIEKFALREPLETFAALLAILVIVEVLMSALALYTATVHFFDLHIPKAPFADAL